MRRFKGQIYLFLAALIWGSSFVFQKMGMDYLGPFTFGIFRFGIGALALLPFILISDKYKLKKEKSVVAFNDKFLLKGSLICGIFTFIGGSLQQIGLVYTTAGKAGFITAMDIIIVPILLLILRKQVSRFIWFGVVIGIFGLYLLCITDGLNINPGDIYIMLCSFGYAFQIIAIDHFAEKTDAVKLSFYQYILASILSLFVALILETANFDAIIDCAVPILYTAILEVAVAFTLQIVGQKYVSAAVAALIMSFESVFSVLAGALLLNEVMTSRELVGCALMFIAIIITQIPEFKKGKING